MDKLTARKASEGNLMNTAESVGMTVTVLTHGPEETLEFGRRLGALLTPGSVVALIGDLAAGKTWLAKGLAFGLDVPNHEYVNSPAYDIVHEYRGRVAVYHMDFYRLDKLSASDKLWIEEYLCQDAVSIIEWADKFIEDLASTYLEIKILFGTADNDRLLTISPVGPEYKQLVQEIATWSEFLA